MHDQSGADDSAADRESCSHPQAKEILIGGSPVTYCPDCNTTWPVSSDTDLNHWQEPGK